jgi:hypothetical protein
VAQTKTITIAQPTAAEGNFQLELAGDFTPGKVFTVSTKVASPVPGQHLTLVLPAGLERIEGPLVQPVQANAPIAWKVKIDAPGKYSVGVKSTTGVTQRKTLLIEAPNRAEGYFQILLVGNFTPGKVFTVSTKVINPAPDQRLTLVLPPELERVEGDETRVARADDAITWKVKIGAAGKFPVAVKSTTGLTQRKTLIIEPPTDQAGRFSFDLSGDIRPGKEFLVTAKVSDPVPGQTLKLVLEKGLQLAEDGATKPVPPAATVSWRVRVAGTGSLPVRIESSTGLVRRKTINLSNVSGLLGQ